MVHRKVKALFACQSETVVELHDAANDLGTTSLPSRSCHKEDDLSPKHRDIHGVELVVDGSRFREGVNWKRG
jgi:hypothetical protein